MSIQAKMKTTATLISPQFQRAETGEVTVEYTGGESVVCDVQPVSGGSFQAEFARRLGADFLAFLPAGTEVNPAKESGAQDILRCGSTDYRVLYAKTYEEFVVAFLKLEA